MERFNPFSSPDTIEDPSSSTTTNFNATNSSCSLPRNVHLTRHQSATRTDSSGSLSGKNSITPAPGRQQIGLTSSADTIANQSSSGIGKDQTLSFNDSRYSTNFPDPFGDHSTSTMFTTETTYNPITNIFMNDNKEQQQKPSNRSNSVTFASSSHSVDDLPQHQVISSPATRTKLSERGQSTAGGLTSFLSRATSVTSSSVTDRVSGAVGSVRSAVDSISNQIQQAVPSNLNERISSATGQFTSSVVGSSSSSMAMPIISRQRVILILDNFNNTDWAQQFNSYRRLMTGGGGLSSGGPFSAFSSVTGAGGAGSGGSGGITSFFSSATAQLTSSSSSSASTQNVISCGDGLDLLIEQADFRDVSVLANQITSTATIIVASNQQRSSLAVSIMSSPSNHKQSLMQQQQQHQVGLKIIRPEYVVVRQKTKDLENESVEHLKNIVKGLNYCLIPMFEPIEIWSIFQDRQLVFSKLLRVQKTLGKENFPLIQQIYFQTYQDLLNYLNSSIITFPCLLRCGSIGKGRIKIDNLQMLKDFSSIVATSGMSCTIEQYLEVKCDLIIQKMGTSLKVFKRMSPQFSNSTENNNPDQQQQQQYQRQSASRQTSIGSMVMSSIMSSTSSSQQQQQQQQQQQYQHQLLDRKNSYNQQQGASYEKLYSDVSVRYKNWIEAISKEFDNLLEAFCLKLAIATNDREYIVGLTNCSNNFMGNQENQDEDRRSFVELIITNMNTNLPKYNSTTTTTTVNNNLTNKNEFQSSVIRRTSSGGGGGASDKNSSIISSANNAAGHKPALSLSQQQLLQNDNIQLKDKKKFVSQTQINHNKHNLIGGNQPMSDKDFSSAKNFGQLTNRSQSISVNQADYYNKVGTVLNSSDEHHMNINSSPLNKPYFIRRGSERSADSTTGPMMNDYDQEDLSCLTGTPTPTTTSFSSGVGGGGGLHQRQTSLGQSFFDQTSTALSSFQKQSMSFFKRLDARGAGDVMGSTPPQSAKSDKGFDRSFLNNDTTSSAATTTTTSNVGSSNRAGTGFKSQSIDSSAIIDSSGSVGRARRTPPKPPPPVMTSIGGIGSSSAHRQSSLSSASSGRAALGHGGTNTPNSTPSQSRENSTVSDSTGNQTRTKVVRQNSALSAFEPYDPDVAAQLRDSTDSLSTNKQHDNNRSLEANTSSGLESESSRSMNNEISLHHHHQHQQQQQHHHQHPQAQKQLDSVKRSSNFDSASITSGDSNSTGETTTAEDTMNNLKKTFASIFGDKCE